MHTELGVILNGPAGAMDARQALVRLDEVLDLLAELEDVDRRRPTSRRRPPRSRWTFADLGVGSVAARIAPLRPRPGTSFEDLEGLTTRAVDGFAEVEEGELLPERWGVEAARVARRLTSRLGATTDTGMRLSLIVDGEVRRSVDVTRRASVHLGRALEARRESIGSVTGSVDSMSVHKKPYIGLWSPRGEGRIRVELPPNLVDPARQVLGNQATVRGRIQRNAAGQILAVRASGIEALPPIDEAPPLSAMVGGVPELTGGVDPVTYLEAMREQA